MKNYLLYLLLSCCFLFGSISNINANHAGLGETVVLVINNCKTGQPTQSFSIPDSYSNKDGGLATPIEVTLSQDSKSPVFSIITKDVNIELPTNLMGTYEVQIKVGNYTTTGKITI